MQEGIATLIQLSIQSLDLLRQYTPTLILAIIVLLIGLRFIKNALKAINIAMDSADVDQTLQVFLSSFTSITLKFILLIILISILGINTAPFIVLLGVAGLAIALALKSPLSDLSSGLLLLLFKPFKVGDFIDIQGDMGKITAIHMIYTIMMTSDNKRLVIPNTKLSSNIIKNLSSEPTRRVDIVFSISYQDDITQAKQVLKTVIHKKQQILSIPTPEIHVCEYADSSVNILTRSWVNTDDYWDVYYYMMEEVKNAFDSNGISIPYPQHEIHIATKAAPHG